MYVARLCYGCVWPTALCLSSWGVAFVILLLGKARNEYDIDGNDILREIKCFFYFFKFYFTTTDGYGYLTHETMFVFLLCCKVTDGGKDFFFM